MGWLGDFLDRLSDFDRAMNGAVAASGLLAGVPRGALADTGAGVAMRPGCLEVLRQAVDAGVPTAVVSVNWSADMVCAALAQRGLPAAAAPGAGGAGAGADGAPPPPGAVAVYANELEFFGDASTGEIRRRCECAADKGRIFDDLLLGLAAEGAPVLGAGASVYVGDSMTDLSALLSADVGIVMGGNQLIRQVAAVAGVPLRPLPAAAAGRPAGAAADAPPVLYEAASWEEVRAFLFARGFAAAAPPPAAPPAARRASGLAAAARGAGVPRVLVVAGSDSGGGAGVQADIKACLACGAFAATAVTALTAQDTRGVAAVHLAPPGFVRRQMAAALDDLGADCVKTGMLPSAEIVEAVGAELRSRGALCPLVVDPVLVATSGDALAQAGVGAALLEHLFPLATLVTPNLPEASALLGECAAAAAVCVCRCSVCGGGACRAALLLFAAGARAGRGPSIVSKIRRVLPASALTLHWSRVVSPAGGRPIADLDAMRAAARDLHAFGPRYVLVKGGHLAASSQEEQRPAAAAVQTAQGGEGAAAAAAALPGRGRVVTDVLFDGRNMVELSAPYIE
jgi:hydroxymethylpyrimidine/phosphomethylpyrimidine kinase/phosphoserine phosphatase